MKNTYTKTFKRSIAAIAVSTVLGMGVANADNLVGKVTISGGDSAGYTVKAVNIATGTKRTVELNADGSYRLAKMPSGQYKITVMKGGAVVAEDTIRASLGTNAVTNFEVVETSNTEIIQIVGSSIATIDISSSDSGLIVGEVEIDRMPIARNLTAVAMLAPGVVKGDDAFGNSASFGGASVAENICYINGMEVTNTRNGLGCGQLPFEFYKEFQIKTGGYSARYGRATGGAVNATAKSGTNEWEFAATATITPDSLRSDNEQKSIGDGGTGGVFRDMSVNEQNNKEFTFSVSGPIIEDKLFFYALVNPRDSSQQFGFNTSFFQEYFAHNQIRTWESSGGDNLFWGATLDWDISEDHRLSYFGYSNRSDTNVTIYNWNIDDGPVNGKGDELGNNLRKRGGTTHSISYTGYITDNLIVTAMAGSIEAQYETSPLNLTCATINDGRDNQTVPAVSCGPGGSFGANEDTNNQFAFDIEYLIGDHTITAGYEFQKRETTRISRPVAGHSYTYVTVGAGAPVIGDNGVLYTNETDAPVDYVQDRIFDGGGGFSSDIKAYFIEDKWAVTDDLTLSLGLRIDEFENVGVTDNILTSFKTDVAPRLGFSWDPTGNGESKFYGTIGQYYLPIANNTIFRAASGVRDTTTHYTFDSINPGDGTPVGAVPVNGTVANSQTVGNVGAIPTKDTFQAQEADPFSKVEYILGYESMLNDEYTFLLKGTYRYVDSALDDYCGSYADPYCVMLNPGEDSSWYKDGSYYEGNGVYADTDQVTDGVADPGSLTLHPNSSTIQLPKGINKYYALESTLRYKLDDLNWSFSYSWSHSYGNFEGAVKSDNGQADAGLTTDFDFPALMDGSYGNLPNDRRHVMKFFGSYNVTDNLVVG